MENKNILNIAIALTIGVILTGSLLMPVIDEYGDETHTYTNEGISFALMDDNEHTMKITNNGGVPEYVVDGVDTTAPTYAFNNQSTVIYGEDGLLRVWKVGDTTRIRIQAADGIGVNLNSGDSATFTFDNNTVSNGTSTATIKPVAYLSNDSEYVQMVNPTVTNDSVIYLAGLTELIHSDVAQFIAIAGYGTIDNLTINVISAVVGTGVTVTGTDYEVVTTDLGNGLKRIDDIAITFTMSDDTTHVGHYTYFIAPKEVSYDNPNYIGESSSLVKVIPIIVIVSILMIAVGAVVIRRAD